MKKKILFGILGTLALTGLAVAANEVRLAKQIGRNS
jgi:hypothetical protein